MCCSDIAKGVAYQVTEKNLGMLREPQHERKLINDIKPTPFVLSVVEGLRKGFFSSPLT
jgi:hypothetical protein